MPTAGAMTIGRLIRVATATLALGLALGGAATRPAAAENQSPVDSNVAALTQDCLDQGGTPSTYWDFDDNGNAQAVVSCDGLGDQSWYACTNDAGYGCDGEPPLTRPPAGYGDPGGNGAASGGFGGALDGGGTGSGGTTMIFNGGQTGGTSDGTAVTSDPTPPSGGEAP